jgi:hypothetical protein
VFSRSKQVKNEAVISDDEAAEELALDLLVRLFCTPKKQVATDVMSSLYEKCQVSRQN